MTTLRTAILITWAVFWVYWLISATTAKSSIRRGRPRPAGLTLIVAVVLLRLFKADTLAVHSVVLEVLGTALFVAGLGLAIWARIYLGRNWGMPMTQREEPELVTSGPYQFVRHPIYSGILLALLGTAVATNVYWLIAFVVTGGYFLYSATVEEKLMNDTFPDAYPPYRARTKMLIPFVL